MSKLSVQEMQEAVYRGTKHAAESFYEDLQSREVYSSINSGVYCAFPSGEDVCEAIKEAVKECMPTKEEILGAIRGSPQ